MVDEFSHPPEDPETKWLRDLRRWLHLGRKGIMLMVRDAQPARLPELMSMLETIDSECAFACTTNELLAVPRGGLVVLVPRERDLDWFNINRPIFEQRALRVVIWAEGDLHITIRFRSPDFRDWVSHFIRCPPISG